MVDEILSVPRLDQVKQAIASGHRLILLGRWCETIEIEDILHNRSFKSVQYHWDDRCKLEKDYRYLETLIAKILNTLSIVLNEAHGVYYSPRSWRILLGPWLSYYTHILFDRFQVVESALHQFDQVGIRPLSDVPPTPPENMTDFNLLISEDCWNEIIFNKIFLFLCAEQMSLAPMFSLMGRKTKSYGSKQSTCHIFLKSLICKLSSLICGKNRYFLYQTYFSRPLYFLVNLLLLQVPAFLRPLSVTYPDCDFSLREALENKLQGRFCAKNEFEFFLINNIFLDMPKVYLEGFNLNRNSFSSAGFPRDPKVIFTSNGYAFDDQFKHYVAEKIIEGARFVIGQHGGLLGLSKFSFSEDHQMAVCDQFLSWGWSRSNNKKIVPGFNLKMPYRVNVDKHGAQSREVITLIQMKIPRYSFHLSAVPIAGQWRSYLEDQFKFVGGLSDETRQELLVRLFSKDYGWQQRDRWADKFPAIRIDDGFRDFGDLLSLSKLVVCSYNATTYLESMYLGIPTVCFWDPRYWELAPDALERLSGLKSVGIYHETPESASKFVNELADDIQVWWDSAAVVSARAEFTNYYSRKVSNPASYLTSVLSL